MEKPPPPPELARILWVALLGSVVLLYVSHRLSPRAVAPADPMVLPMFAVIAAAAAAASLFYPGIIFRLGANKLALETSEVPGVITPEFPNAMRRVFLDPEKARAAALKLYQVSLVFGLALGEMPAMFGLVLGRQGHAEALVLPFFVASLVVMGLRYPGPRAAEKMLERALGASFP